MPLSFSFFKISRPASAKDIFLMKTLRHNRILLGWFMTVLVFAMQVATPLRSATIYWDTTGVNGGGQTTSGTWDTTTANWVPNAPNATAQTQAAWVNSNASIADFGLTGSSTSQTITLGTAVTTNGLQLDNTFGFSLTSAGTVASPTGVLTFAGTSPTISIGSGSTTTAYIANINAALSGNSGLTVQTGNTGTGTTARLILGAAGTGANYANNLTGGITVGANTTVEAIVRTGNNNPLGTNAITLQGTSNLDLTGTRNGAIGISGRLFSLSTSLSDTSRVDFTGTATGASLPSQSLVGTGSAGQNVVTLSSVVVGTGTPPTTAALSVGQIVTGAGIPTGARVGQILNGTQFTVVNSSNQALNLTAPITSLTVTPLLTSQLTSNPTPSLPLSPTLAFTNGLGLDGSAGGSIRYVDANNVVQTLSNYAVQYVGQLNITTAGGYTLFAKPDDAARIYVDGVLVLNNDGGKGATDLSSALLQLGVGYHTVRVDYLQATGGGSLDLGYAGPGTSIPYTRVNLIAAMYQAESNTAAASSDAIALNNDIHLTGSAGINLKGNGASSYQLGGLTLDSGLTLTVKATDSNGTTEIAGGGGGFGQTLRFAGSSLFGSTGTINADVNVAFDGTVSDGGSAMTLLKTGTGQLFFDQTSVANNLGVGHTSFIEMQATKIAQTATYSTSAATVTVTDATNMRPGMTVTGNGIPNGAFITSISGNVLTISATPTAAGSSALVNVSATPTLVLTGTPVAGTFNPIGSATVWLDGGNLMLDSKGSTVAGVGPTFANDVKVTKDSGIQSVANAATTIMGSSSNTITITSQSVSSTAANASATVTVPTGTAYLHVGQVVSGTGIAAGTTIKSIDSPTSITLSQNAGVGAGTNNLSYGTTLVLDAISGGVNTSLNSLSTDPGATLAVASNIVGDATTTIIIRSTVMNAGTTIPLAQAQASGTAQATGTTNVTPGVVALRGNNSGFLGTILFEANAGLRVEGVNALYGRSFALNTANTLFLADDGDGTGARFIRKIYAFTGI